MTDLKYSILGVLYSNKDRQESKTNLINLNLDTPTSTHHAINELLADSLVKAVIGTDRIALTHLGATAYEQANEDRKHQADQKRQQRFENKISVASVLVPLITFFLGVIVESQVNIVEWFRSLFS